MESVAERLDLTDVLDEYPDSLPHADLRRLEIARALATDPELLLLDEPFAGLNKQEMRNLSEAITAVRDDGITIVIIDHNMRGLMALVDEVLVLHNGRKLVQGDPDAVTSDERVQQAYLAGWDEDDEEVPAE
ncbi:branched-chain amino acid transport ATP-binding protein LivG [Halarchaeum acidiphilum MH1-52-1]|uniref:Branched-chain amino acid transport ATP-binding protein LivG n=1 Tax=Halarchaeum acidiphilum MH1-52-1 TaxID=1261545 RepID=U2YHA3_9EURY|nr:branched-chain amino acid transport ATP-binding protein LivG [Halarchaeum acidiphilum MH1-52-1]